MYYFIANSRISLLKMFSDFSSFPALAYFSLLSNGTIS